MRSCCVAAVRFIRQHAKRSISIDSVVDAVFLSGGFWRSDFGIFRVVLYAVKSAGHVSNRAFHKLMEAQMSISEVAHGLGFPDVAHISRHFRKDFLCR